MGDRFYQQQIEATGNCPGLITTKRRKRVAWTDEEKQQAIAAYEEAGPTAENSAEIVKEIAEDMGQSPNGVRMILVQAKVYIKTTATPSTGSGSSGGGSRVSKAAAQEGLTAALVDAGAEVDEEIISKLTGKAAVYFTGVLSKIAS